MADVFAAIIVDGKTLTPLKTKEKPKVSISNCVRPKGQLRGGGNASQSYVTCRMCNARWESPLPVSGLREYLKESKTQNVDQGGLLNQEEAQEMEMEAMSDEWGFPSPDQLAMVSQQLREEQERSQALEAQLEKLKARVGRSLGLGRTSKAAPKPTSRTPAPSSQSVAVNRVAEALMNNLDYDPVRDGVTSPAILVESDGEI